MYSIQELSDLKLLQKQEQKQFQDLAFKNQLVKEQQERRFEVERVTLMKNYDTQSRPSRKRSQAHFNLDGTGVDDLGW